MQENSVEETSPEKYCVCGHEDGNFMIECTAQNPKCNGWIHPSCFNLSENEIQIILKMDKYFSLLTPLLPSVATSVP